MCVRKSVYLKAGCVICRLDWGLCKRFMMKMCSEQKDIWWCVVYVISSSSSDTQKTKTGGAAIDKLRFVYLYSLTVESWSCSKTEACLFIASVCYCYPVVFVQLISRRPLTTESRDQSHTSTCRICGKQRHIGTGFSLSVSYHRFSILIIIYSTRDCNGHRGSFPGGDHPPRSNAKLCMNRAIPLPPLWAVLRVIVWPLPSPLTKYLSGLQRR